jgi:glycosyltransferase involved in cell wall biosynthesis
MHVFHFVQSVAVHYGGTGFAAQQLSEHLANLACPNLKITLTVLQPSEKNWPVRECSSLRWNVLPTLTKIQQLGALVKFIRHEANVDLIHLHGIWSPLWAFLCIWARFKGITCVVSPHGSLHPWALAHKSFKKKLAWRLYQKHVLQSVNAIWTTSSEELRYVRDLKIKVPIVMIPNGVQIPTDLELAEAAASVSAHCERHFLFMSRLHPVKGLDMLVDAWAAVHQAGWKIHVAGEDDAGHQAQIEQKLRDHGLADDFVWLGMLHGKAKLEALAQADVFILPTHSENFGLVVAEALACGKPVITTKGAPWQSLLTSNAGWWCDATADAVGTAMKEAMSQSPQALGTMGQRGREMVAVQYGWPKLSLLAKSAYAWLDAQKKANSAQMARPLCVHINT